jgi:peptide/nickel transport system permease protein
VLDLKRIPLSALIGLFLTALFLFAALFAPWIAPYGNGQIVGDVWGPMSATHLLGTDNLGRDLLSRMIYGARITIFIAVAATALSFILGSVLGFTAAVVGGWIDQTMSRFVDLLMSIPTLIFALVVLSVLPSTLVTLILVMGILDATRVYRLARAVAVDINVMDFVEAAKLRGEGRSWIIFREILPNALPSLACVSSSRFCSCRRSPSSASACSHLMPTGAAWSRRTRTASCSASRLR